MGCNITLVVQVANCVSTTLQRSNVFLELAGHSTVRTETISGNRSANRHATPTPLSDDEHDSMLNPSDSPAALHQSRKAPTAAQVCTVSATLRVAAVPLTCICHRTTVDEAYSRRSPATAARHCTHSTWSMATASRGRLPKSSATSPRRLRQQGGSTEPGADTAGAGATTGGAATAECIPRSCRPCHGKYSCVGAHAHMPHRS